MLHVAIAIAIVLLFIFIILQHMYIYDFDRAAELGACYELVNIDVCTYLL